MSLTDSRRLWKLASERGTEGIHSHECRRLGISGNPSQRSKDIADHVAFWTRREARNGRPGARYWVDGCQPQDAVPVRPNGGVEGGVGHRTPVETGGPAVVSGIDAVQFSAPLNITPAPEDTHHPVAIVRDFDGSWAELPWDEENHRPLREAA